MSYLKRMDEILDIIGIKQQKYEDEDIECDASTYLDLFNVFLIYYKGVYNTEKHLLSDINPAQHSSTNRATEMLYGYIKEYEDNMKNGSHLVDIYNLKTIDMDKFEELYGLTLRDEIIGISPSIYSLFLYVSKTCDWQECKWKITQIKSKN